MIEVLRADPAAPEARRLLEASHALMTALFPAEANSYLSIAQLQGPEISFFVAQADGQTLGTGALADKGDYAELKSLFVDEAARGKGLAAALIDRLETEAQAQGHQIMRLETGTKLEAAHRLYERCGYVRRDVFGDYDGNPFSVFMEKRLTPRGAT